jgi:hypothetical protein
MARTRAWLILILLLLPLRLHAASKLSMSQVDAMFAAKARQTFPWKLGMSKPVLTFEQLYLMKIEAEVDPSKFRDRNAAHAFEFFARVADAHGHWLPASDFTSIELSEDFSAKQVLQFVSALYLSPGSYEVAVVLADTKSGIWNSGRTTVQVRPESGEIEAIDAVAPSAEFLQDVQNAENDSQGLRGERRNARGGGNNALWHFGHMLPHVAVNTSRPLVIDVLLLMRTDEDAGQHRSSLVSAHRGIGRSLQIGSLLSHVHPSAGCTRVTALEIMRQKLLLDRVPAEEADFDGLQGSLTAQERNSIQLATLERRDMALSQLAETVDKLRNDTPQCGGQKAEHVLIVVADPLTFPVRTMRPQPFTENGGRVFYLRNFYGEWDDIQPLLKTLHVKRYDFGDPLSFRHAFRELLAELRK